MNNSFFLETFPAYPFNYHIAHKSRWSAMPICLSRFMLIYDAVRAQYTECHMQCAAPSASMRKQLEQPSHCPILTKPAPPPQLSLPASVCVLMTVCVCVYTERPGSKKCWGSAVADWENDFRADRDHCNSSNMWVCEPARERKSSGFRRPV